MTPTQGEHAQTALAHELFAAAQLATGEGIEDAVSRIAAALTAATAQPAAPQGVAYAELPEGWPARFRCDSCDGNGEVGEPISMGHFQPPERERCPDCDGRGWCSEEPAFSADHMRDFADRTHALRTKSEANREFLERMLSAMEGVIDVADRQTDEFEALRSCVVDLTLMLFKPEALRASNGQAPAQPAALPSDRELQEIAMQAAWRHSREPDAPKYLPRSPVHAATWKPHAWVVAAMKDAIEAATQPKKDHHDELS